MFVHSISTALALFELPGKYNMMSFTGIQAANSRFCVAGIVCCTYTVVHRTIPCMILALKENKEKKQSSDSAVKIVCGMYSHRA